MNAVVLDASIVIKWFRSAGEAHVEAARLVRGDLEAGKLVSCLVNDLSYQVC